MRWFLFRYSAPWFLPLSLFCRWAYLFSYLSWLLYFSVLTFLLGSSFYIFYLLLILSIFSFFSSIFGIFFMASLKSLSDNCNLAQCRQLLPIFFKSFGIFMFSRHVVRLWSLSTPCVAAGFLWYLCGRGGREEGAAPSFQVEVDVQVLTQSSFTPQQGLLYIACWGRGWKSVSPSGLQGVGGSWPTDDDKVQAPCLAIPNTTLVQCYSQHETDIQAPFKPSWPWRGAGPVFLWCLAIIKQLLSECFFLAKLLFV